MQSEGGKHVWRSKQ